MSFRQFLLLLLFSHYIVSESLQPHGLQYTRLFCPPLSPRVCSNSCPLSRWCYLTNILCHLLLFLPSIFPSIRVFSNESALSIKWQKYWSFNFSISRFSEYSVLIYFRIDIWSPRSPRNSQESSPAPQIESINSLALPPIGRTNTFLGSYYDAVLTGQEQQQQQLEGKTEDE